MDANESKTSRAADFGGRVRGIEGPDDERRVVRMYAYAFTQPGSMEAHLSTCLFKPPIYNPEHTRFVEVGDEIVAGVTMAPRMMKFGSVTVPAMTIGPVGTDFYHRNKGYASTAMDDACRYMKEQGVMVAYLQGIRDFYFRYGFFPFMATNELTVQRSHAEREAALGKLRRMTRADMPAVRRMYNTAVKGRVGPSVRNTEIWEWLTGPATRSWLFRDPMCILDASGAICGYCTGVNGPNPLVPEIVVRRNDDAFRVALGALVRHAKRREWQEFDLWLPSDDPFAVFLRQYIPVKTTMKSESTGGPVLKIVDFPRLLKRLEPLLGERWAKIANRHVRFRIASEIGAADVALSPDGLTVDIAPGADVSGSAGNRETIPVVKIAARWLSGLITGYYSVNDISSSKGVVIPRDLVEVIDVLFPPGRPFVYRGDNY